MFKVRIKYNIWYAKAVFWHEKVVNTVIGEMLIATNENGSQSRTAIIYLISRVSSRISASQFSSTKAEISSIRLSAMA